MPITAELTKEFRFEAAHFLPRVPVTHSCHKLHGHSYRVTVTVRGEVDEDKGWALDLGEISNLYKPLREMLDHSLLNDIEGLENPTGENLCLWVLRKLKKDLPQIYSVTVRATRLVSVTIRAQDLD